MVYHLKIDISIVIKHDALLSVPKPHATCSGGSDHLQA